MEKVPPSDTRSKSSVFEAAKRAEVLGLTERNVCNVDYVSSIPETANIIGVGFELTVKNPGADRQKAKDRFIGLGYKDEMNFFIVHSCQTLRQSSMKIILSASAIMNYRISMVEFVRAYLQAK